MEKRMVGMKASRRKSVIGHLAVCAFIAGIFLILTGCDQTEKTRQTINQRASQTQQTLDMAQKPAPSRYF